MFVKISEEEENAYMVIAEQSSRTRPATLVSIPDQARKQTSEVQHIVNFHLTFCIEPCCFPQVNTLQRCSAFQTNLGQ